MKRFSQTLKKLFLRFTPSQAPQSAQDVAPLDHQTSLGIPYSSTLGRLADSALQAEARRCLAIIGEKPTDEQWDMILASTTSTAVSAGAGSGKSTTLILRLLVMHKLLGIPLDEMHVFSFTNASVRDFRKKLREKLFRWEELIEQKSLTSEQRAGIEKLVERTVSTFHSVLYRLRRDVLPGLAPSTEIFDTLKDERFSGKQQVDMTDEDVKSENPFLSAILSAKQDEVLKAAHERAFQNSQRYEELMTVLREELDRLYWLRMTEAPTPEDQMKRWFWDRLLLQERFYHGYDPWEYEPGPGYSDAQSFPYIDPYRATVANWLIARGVAFVPLVRFSIPCPIPGIEPGEFFASFQIDDQLFLHVERYSAAQPPTREDELRLAFHERDRRRFIAAYSENTDQHKVLKVDDFEVGKGGVLHLKPDAQLRLRQWIHLRTNALPLTGAPALLVRLPGDIREVDIKELLYQEGMFIESMGGEVEQFPLPASGSLDPVSLAFAEALPLFWSAFSSELKRWRYIRYHDILSRLRDEEVLGNVLGKLKHLRHLFIDEFQDISPEIVDWLAKTLYAHVREGAEVSVIAIGDDYQSIYGWRGSHPTFLMRFDRYFPSPSMGWILLTNNFRSRQPIIDAAEAVLVPMKQKSVKQGRSVFQGREAGGVDPVCLEEAQLSWNATGATADIWSVFCTYIGKLLSDLEGTGYLAELMGMREELSVYILARTNATRRTIPDLKGLRKRLFEELHLHGVTRFQKISMSARTFHQSKGLEADVVLLLDDPQLPDEHPLRELVFSRASVLEQEAGTYRQTMADETYRLAYVALTRARLAVMWMPLTERKNDGDVQSDENDTGQAHAAVSTQGCFVLVKNYLQASGRLQML